MKMIQTAKEEKEKAVAAKTLWTLAFDDENKKVIKEDENAISVLHELQQNGNSETRKAAAGALWELEGKDKHSEESRAKGNKYSNFTQSVLQKARRTHSPKTLTCFVIVSESTQHIMVSYQWDVQDVVIQIRDKLQAVGFKVWMDVDEMGGSTLESMAKAVEDAAVVLICVSHKYKDSPNCRSGK